MTYKPALAQQTYQPYQPPTSTTPSPEPAANRRSNLKILLTLRKPRRWRSPVLPKMRQTTSLVVIFSMISVLEVF
jgi:hypothetical protein